MFHFGVNIYHWGEREQLALLIDGLRPLAQELRHEGLSEGFWFTRFDARGPHVFAVFSVPPARRFLLEERATKRLGRYLSQHPSRRVLTPAELEERHLSCRGKVLCAADHETGFAANNSTACFEHASTAYPFCHTVGLDRERELWRLLGDASLWTLDRVAAGRGTASAMSWIASVDEGLRRAGAAAGGFWRHHASSLILTLEKRLRSTEDEVLASLQAAVGETNRRLFTPIWKHAESGGPAWPGIPRLLDIVLADDGRSERQRWALLREINHWTLAQLTQPVQAHIPLVLFAWQRNLSLPAAA
jgi:hypothetical protein